MSSLIVKELKINFYEIAWKNLIKLLVKETGIDHNGMIKKALDAARDQMVDECDKEFHDTKQEFLKIAGQKLQEIGNNYIDAIPKTEGKKKE